jgi:predicted GNAT family acetyltransferase
MALEIQHDEARRKFFTILDGEEGYMTYAPVSEGTMDFQSTFVPPSMRGKGAAGAIVQAALEWAQEKEYKVVPSCWYVDQYLNRHPRFQALRAER